MFDCCSEEVRGFSPSQKDGSETWISVKCLSILVSGRILQIVNPGFSKLGNSLVQDSETLLSNSQCWVTWQQKPVAGVILYVP